MRRKLAGIALLLHGLAHAGPGMWVFDRTQPWIVSTVWGVAIVGFLAAGFGLLGLPALRRHARVLAVAAAMSSIGLVILWPHPAFLVGGVLDLVVIAAAARWPSWDVSSPGRRAWVGRVAGVLGSSLAVYVAVLVLVRPWHLRWGATDLDLATTLPGDGLVPDAHYRMDHVITIRAPADSVWQWLVQIGQDRAGFYSYAWLENLIGAEIRNSDRVVPAWQHREVGELVRSVPPDYLGGRLGDAVGWRIAEMLPGRALVLENWGAFVVRPVNHSTTRLHIRLRGEGRPSLAGVALAPFGLLVFEPAHFIMERGMLRGIKARAERQSSWATVAARRAGPASR